MGKRVIIRQLESLMESGTLSTQAADKLAELINFIRSEG